MYLYEIRNNDISRYRFYNSDGSPHGPFSSQFRVKDDTTTILLDESWFYFLVFAQKVSVKDNSGFSIKEFYRICSDSYRYYLTQAEQFPAKHISYFVDDIYSQSERKDYILGQKNDFSFSLILYFVQYMIADHISLLPRKPFLVPSSLGTVHHIKIFLQHKNFVLLYLYDGFVKLISIRDGYYDKITSINLGKRKLIAMIEEAGLHELFRAVEEGELLHDSLSKSLEKIYRFYIHMLLERIDSEVDNIQKLLLVGGGLSYPFFTQVFHRLFVERFSGFLIPLHLSFAQNYHGDCAMTDVLCMQHYEEYFQKNYHIV